MFFEKTTDALSNALNNLGPYMHAIDEVRPHKRPVLLWSAASLVYVHFDLSITSVGVGSTQVSGVTDEKLACFFLLALLYYLSRWAYWNWIALRSYWREGMLCHLWNATATANFHIGFEEIQERGDKPVRCFEAQDKTSVRVVTNDLRLKTEMDDIARSYWTSRLTFLLSFYGVPFIFPLFVAMLAMIALFGSLLEQ